MAGGDAPVISVYNVSKRFVTHRRKASSLKERIVRREKGEIDGQFWALRNINLEIAPGETVGLIGHNGSGKSTLLKILAGILKPNEGEAHVGGRVASLLELGAGFSEELSGRDNVYLNASLLGIPKKQTEKLFDSIVDFSELGGRIDDPVKVYSSGMYVKLAFSVAVHVDPDILLVDEVLAVGDEKFQEKCLAKIEEFQNEGRTILLVTHALDIVAKMASRAIVLDHGEMKHDGDPTHGVALMRGLIGVAPMPEPPKVDPFAAMPVHMGITDLKTTGSLGGEPQYVFQSGDPVHFRVEVDVTEGVKNAGEVAVVVMGPGQFPLVVMHGGGGGTVPPQPGTWHVDFYLPALPPLVGPFEIAVSVTDSSNERVLAARTFDDAFAVPGERANGLLDTRWDVSVTSAALTQTQSQPGTPDVSAVAPTEPHRSRQPVNEAVATVVIVNWNGAHLLPACLGALAEQELPDGDTFSTVVVDNASTDGSLELLAGHPDVTVIADDTNRGFAGGNNTALRHVETPFAVLLNNDATPQPGWLANLLKPFHEAGGDRIGMTTGKVVFDPRFAEISLATAGFTPGAHDDRDLGVRIHQVLVNGVNVIGDVLWERLTYGREGDGFFWTRPAGTMLVPVPPEGEVTLGFAWAAETEKPVTLSTTETTATLSVPAHDPAVATMTLPAATKRVDVINNVGGVVLTSGHGADRGYQQVDRGQFDEPADVFLGCGNGMALRTAVGRQLDFFDDDFFLYYEDSDLSWRLRSLGWTIRYVPSAVLRHHHAASSGEWSPLFVFHTERNRLLNLTKNAQASLAFREVPRFVLTTASMTLRAVRQLLATRSRPAIRPLILRGRVLQSYLTLLPTMLRKRSAIKTAARVDRAELETLLVTADEWRNEGAAA